MVANSEPPSLNAPLTSPLPPVYIPWRSVAVGSCFIPLPKFLRIVSVPIFSKTTSAMPVKAALLNTLQSEILSVLESLDISDSLTAISKGSASGLLSNHFLLSTILLAASFCAIALPSSTPPAPLAKNSGKAKGPVAAIDKEGAKLIVEFISQLPTSVAFLISSTSIAV